jgi:hypothetical protein
MNTKIRLEKSVRAPYMQRTIVYAEEGYDLSTEQVPGVIAFEDELIVQAL